MLAAGTPVAGATVTAGGDLGSEEFTTDDRGVVTLTEEQIEDAGVMSVRTSVTLPGAGVYDGKPFPETRRYATAVFTAGDFEQAAEPSGDASANKIVVAEVAGADLPEGVTSLGAAASGGYLYYYGGHPGTAHKYSTDEQSNAFRRLDLSDPAAGWEDLPGGPKLQGLALVAHPAGGVVRVGGFTARNSLEEDHDLHSVPTVSHYDPEQGEWTDLTPLPGGRSSFDARVLGDKVYVFGGWMMAGAEGEAWHGTGYMADLTADELEWEVLPMPHPRRALSVAAVPETNELYLIGGMPPTGEPTRRVDIYDAKTGTFARGPDLPGETMDGFGSAAFAANGAVYVTTLTGKVLRLKPGADAWEPLGELEKARFFHQLVPAGDGAAVLSDRRREHGGRPVHDRGEADGRGVRAPTAGAGPRPPLSLNWRNGSRPRRLAADGDPADGPGPLDEHGDGPRVDRRRAGVPQGDGREPRRRAAPAGVRTRGYRPGGLAGVAGLSVRRDRRRPR